MLLTVVLRPDVGPFQRAGAGFDITEAPYVDKRDAAVAVAKRHVGDMRAGLVPDPINDFDREADDLHDVEVGFREIKEVMNDLLFRFEQLDMAMTLHGRERAGLEPAFARKLQRRLVMRTEQIVPELLTTQAVYVAGSFCLLRHRLSFNSSKWTRSWIRLRAA